MTERFADSPICGYEMCCLVLGMSRRSRGCHIEHWVIIHAMIGEKLHLERSVSSYSFQVFSTNFSSLDKRHHSLRASYTIYTYHVRRIQ